MPSDNTLRRLVACHVICRMTGKLDVTAANWCAPMAIKSSHMYGWLGLMSTRYPMLT